MIRSFDDFSHKYSLGNKTTSNSIIRQILSSLCLSDVGIHLRDGHFIIDIGIVNLHSTKGTHWVEHIKQKDFDLYGLSPPVKFSF